MAALFLSLLAFAYLFIGSNFSLHGAFYGEGLVLTTTLRLLSGELLYRDILTVYPPGIFLLELLAWKCLGATLLADRIVSLVAQAALSGILYATCRRMTTPLFSLLAFLACLAFLGRVTLFGYPTIPALIFVFVSLQATCTSLENHSRPRLFWAGCLAGLVCLFRHDFALYLLVVVFVLLTLHRVSMLPFLVGLILLISPWVGYFLAKGAFPDLVSSLFLYTSPIYSKAMALTFPAFNRGGAIHYLPLCVTFLGGLYLFPLFKRRKGLNSADRLFISLLLFHSVSLINFFNRPDRPHLVAPLILSCPLFFFLIERWGKTLRVSGRHIAIARGVAVALTLAFLWRPTGQKLHFLLVERRASNVFAYSLERLSGIYDNDPAGKALEEAVRFIVGRSEKNERIFVGLPRYDDPPEACDLLFYFLADRLPVVKYQELGERGLVTSAEGQQAIMEDLKKRGVQWIVIHTFPDWEIHYRYPLKGATLLDEYIRNNYTTVKEFPPYKILRRQADTATPRRSQLPRWTYHFSL